MGRLLAVAGLAAFLLILAGCKAESTTSPSEAGAGDLAPTSVAAATAVTAPTATPEASATAAVKAIEVIGDDDFKAWTARALELIELKAPEAFAAVQASIDVINSVAAGSGMYIEEKRFAVGDQTAHAPGYDEDGQLLWYAGTIVHDAHHSDQFRRGVPHAGKAAEVECLTVQQAALRLMTEDPFFPTYLQGLIDGAGDGASQYWNQPNRHW